MRLNRIVPVAGPPVMCHSCRQPFKPAVIVNHTRKKYATGLRCPRCVASEKATKRGRKEGRAQ